MKDLYPEYYQPDLDKLWKDAVFVLDTNVLLNLYCYPEPERNDFLQALERIQARLWLPSHVVYEYQKLREEKIQDQHNMYKKSEKEIAKLKQGIESLIDNHRHPDNELNVAELLQPVRKALQDAIDRIKQHDKPQLTTAENDPIRVCLDSIYSGDKVGKRYSIAEILKLTEEWHIRKENKMPPGFNDGKPGDYIIWTQIIEYARENQKPIIFVTDDGKNDWVKDGKPLPELRGEMYQNAQVDCWIYSTEHFSSEGKKRKYLTIADETIKTAAETATQATEDSNYEDTRERGSSASLSRVMKDFERMSEGVQEQRIFMKENTATLQEIDKVARQQMIFFRENEAAIREMNKIAKEYRHLFK